MERTDNDRFLDAIAMLEAFEVPGLAWGFHDDSGRCWVIGIDQLTDLCERDADRYEYFRKAERFDDECPCDDAVALRAQKAAEEKAAAQEAARKVARERRRQNSSTVCAKHYARKYRSPYGIGIFCEKCRLEAVRAESRVSA